MPDSLCLITLGSVTMHIKSVSCLRLIVNSCIAELDLFKFICITLILFSFSRVSAMDGRMSVSFVLVPCLIPFAGYWPNGTMMDTYPEMLYVANAGASGPPGLTRWCSFGRG